MTVRAQKSAILALAGLILSMLTWFASVVYADSGTARRIATKNSTEIKHNRENIDDIKADLREIKVDIKELLRR